MHSIEGSKKDDRDEPEISDVVVSYDPVTLERRAVTRDSALSQLRSQWAKRIVRDLPEREGVLDAETVDRSILAAHAELQRLWEEFHHGARVARVLRAQIRAIRSIGISRPITIVDIGCGVGFVLRWLRAHEMLAKDTELVGVDHNPVLIGHAKHLAATEHLKVRFEVGNAFRLDGPADIFISSGVLHHFRGSGLDAFFREQASRRPLAYAHFDIQASWIAPFGAFLFHIARMRTPIARYDGFRSATRAHSADTLTAVATAHAGELAVARYAPSRSFAPVLRTIGGLIAVPRETVATFTKQLRGPSTLLDWRLL